MCQAYIWFSVLKRTDCAFWCCLCVRVGKGQGRWFSPEEPCLSCGGLTHLSLSSSVFKTFPFLVAEEGLWPLCWHRREWMQEVFTDQSELWWLDSGPLQLAKLFFPMGRTTVDHHNISFLFPKLVPSCWMLRWQLMWNVLECSSLDMSMHCLPYDIRMLNTGWALFEEPFLLYI